MVAFRVQPHARTRATRARRSHPCASALREWAQPRRKKREPRGAPIGDTLHAAASKLPTERSRRPVVPPQARLLVALALCGTAAAYVAPQAPKSASALNSKAELEALAEANGDFLGSTLGFWDPLGVTNLDFWGLGEEGTIGYLRHAEIKHGRVAMAGFLGFCAQSTPLVAGEHSLPYRYRGESLTYPTPPYRGFVENVSPQEQWDNIPLIGKLQIFGIIGMLESYGEILDVHYTNGGLPGYYPPIRGNRPELWFNLYDPFNWFDEDKDKVRGRQVEINNGRLAMLGILSILSESKVPGSVPLITGLIPEYSGSYMVPFEADFSLFN